MSYRRKGDTDTVLLAGMDSSVFVSRTPAVFRPERVV
jgi:hypothetical protein